MKGENLELGVVEQSRVSLLSLFIITVLMFCVVMPLTVDAAGLLKSVSGEDNGLAIRSHKVVATINNGFAKTEVDQVFANTTDKDMEAVYTFPLPKQASLSELSFWADGREILGEVVEKERARKIYEDQKAKGNDTALAEQDDFKSFNVTVGRVPAGDEVRVRIVYYQPIEIDLNVGRYLYPLAEGDVDEKRIAFWSVDDKVSGPFSFNLKLKSAFSVKEVRMPNYQNEATVQKISSIGDDSSSDIYDVSLVKEQGSDLSRDIVFYYRLDDSVPARVELIPYRDNPQTEGTFMVVVTPAADLKRINEGVDWTFVLDVSGSMGGHKIATLADGVSRVIGKMSPNDRFRIVTFNNNANELTSGYVTATPDNVKLWINNVKSMQAGGGTNVFSGLKLGYDGMEDDRTTSIILVTDGVANVGKTRQLDFLNMLKNYDIRLFTFVIGNSANQPLLEMIALESGGFAINISDSDDIAGKLMQAKAKVFHENLHDVELKFGGERVKDLTPAKTGNLYIGQQLVMFGRYNGSGDLKLTLKAKISGEEKSWHTTAYLPEMDKDNPEIERLWALSAIEDEMKKIRKNGESEKLRKKVIDLGIEYSLVTNYTSMVAVRDDVLENEGIQKRNADRVQKESKAQQARKNGPVKNYRVDNSTVSSNHTGSSHTASSGGMFGGRSAPGIGTGPVGPLFVLGAYWLMRRKKSHK